MVKKRQQTAKMHRTLMFLSPWGGRLGSPFAMSVKEDDDFYHILPPEIWEMVAPYAEARTMMSLKLTCKLAVVCHPDWHLPYPPALLRYSWANDGIRKIALCAFMRQRLFLVDGMRGA